MPTDYPAPAVDSIPSVREIAPHHVEPLDLAAEHLDGPIQTRIRAWEDGEFEIRIYHGYSSRSQRPGVAYRHVLRNHNCEDESDEGLMAVDGETAEKSLIHERSWGRIT